MVESEPKQKIPPLCDVYECQHELSNLPNKLSNKKGMVYLRKKNPNQELKTTRVCPCCASKLIKQDWEVYRDAKFRERLGAFTKRARVIPK